MQNLPQLYLKLLCNEMVPVKQCNYHGAAVASKEEQAVQSLKGWQF